MSSLFAVKVVDASSQGSELYKPLPYSHLVALESYGVICGLYTITSADPATVRLTYSLPPGERKGHRSCTAGGLPIPHYVLQGLKAEAKAAKLTGKALQEFGEPPAVAGEPQLAVIKEEPEEESPGHGKKGARRRAASTPAMPKTVSSQKSGDRSRILVGPRADSTRVTDVEQEQAHREAPKRISIEQKGSQVVMGIQGSKDDRALLALGMPEDFTRSPVAEYEGRSKHVQPNPLEIVQVPDQGTKLRANERLSEATLVASKYKSPVAPQLEDAKPEVLRALGYILERKGRDYRAVEGSEELSAAVKAVEDYKSSGEWELTSGLVPADEAPVREQKLQALMKLGQAIDAKQGWTRTKVQDHPKAAGVKYTDGLAAASTFSTLEEVEKAFDVANSDVFVCASQGAKWSALSQYLAQLLRYTRREESEWGQLLVGADLTRRSAKAGLAKHMIARAGEIASGGDVNLEEYRRIQNLSNRVAAAADCVFQVQVQAAAAEMESLVKEVQSEEPPTKRFRLNVQDEDAPMPAKDCLLYTSPSPRD